jgi:class 3 adenylate cyclase
MTTVRVGRVQCATDSFGWKPDLRRCHGERRDRSDARQSSSPATLERLKALRRELIDPKIAAQRGRIVKTTEYGPLVEFATPVAAVRCAGQTQKGMESPLPEERRIEIRIGINLGDDH